MNLDETIVAIASPAGSAQRGILRLSGADAVTISDRVFRPAEGPPIGERETFSVCAGSLCLDGQRLEIPAEVYLMRSPRSYTREDVVEFHLPSCPALWPAVLEAFTRAGVRLAEPGEFTARAFLNGRLDLAQAEAVMAIVNASSQRALRAATEMLSGHLSARVGPVGQEIRDLLGLVEAGIDFAEDDIELIRPEDLRTRVLDLRDWLIDLGRHGRRVETFDGSVRLTIAGRPNAGKSSLFNAILGYSRTIVADRPGTTRDRISHAFTIGGIAFELSDTAGLGAGGGALDRAAHQKAIEALDYADLALIVFEAVGECCEEASRILGSVASPVVAAITKCDLGSAGPVRKWLSETAPGVRVVETSAKTGQGIEELKALLVEVIEGGGSEREAVQPIVTTRHKMAISLAAEALARAHGLSESAGGEEFIALELREALDQVGQITGQVSSQDILSDIFSNFCIGK